METDEPPAIYLERIKQLLQKVGVGVNNHLLKELEECDSAEEMLEKCMIVKDY